MKNEKVLTSVDAGSHPMYLFTEHDENSICLKHAERAEQYIVIDKQSLGQIASALSDLAKHFRE